MGILRNCDPSSQYSILPVFHSFSISHSGDRMIPYKQETRLQGIPVSDGVVVARVCLFNEGRHSNLPANRVAGTGTKSEWNRVERAVELAAGQLEALKQDVAEKIGKAESEIFSAQQMILHDAKLHAAIRQALDSKAATAETAVAGVFEAYEERFKALNSESLRDRASDIGELKRRVLDLLSDTNPTLMCAGQEHCQRGRHRIVVAEELTPTLALELDTEDIKGFLTERGGKTSHAAILARALGIPAVTGLAGVRSLIGCGTEVMIDGHTGEVVFWPSEQAKAAIPALRKKAEAEAQPVGPVPGMVVMANLSVAADSEEALAFEAEGVGLYRTEFEFFAAGRLLSEDEQYERYRKVIERMAGRPVTFRLIDIGGDKTAPYFGLEQEMNPYLGFRGSRLLLARKDLLVPQARALARASRHGPVQVMYPMIIDLDQFRLMRRRFNEATADLAAVEIRHGVMFEVPSACLQAPVILEEADFGSIGTNDLIQYLFAVDRNNDRVSYDFVPDRAVLWTVIEQVLRAGQAAGKPISICGEIAADPHFVPRMLEAGVKIVSMSPRRIPAVRRAVMEFSKQ